MEKEKLNNILDSYIERIEKYEAQIVKLEHELEYCSKHNLKEEERINLVKYTAMDRVVWNFRKMYNEVKEIL